MPFACTGTWTRLHHCIQKRLQRWADDLRVADGAIVLAARDDQQPGGTRTISIPSKVSIRGIQSALRVTTGS
jgi:hypothetical protein